MGFSAGELTDFQIKFAKQQFWDIFYYYKFELMNDRSYVNKKHYAVLIIFFALYCLFLSWSFLFQNVDDAYISFRYGRNFIQGNGLVFNTGEKVEGYTNFLWTIITSPFTIIETVDISYFALLLGFVFTLINISVILKIIRLFSLYFLNKPAYLILLPVIFFVLDDSVAFWAIGGMEFPLYTLFILSAAYYYFRINEKPNSHILVTVFFILCTLTRPEGNLLFALTIFHMMMKHKYINSFRKKIIQMTGLYLLFALVYYGFKYFYYGHFIPNTFFAKGVTDIQMNLILGFKYLALCIGSRFYIFIFILFIPFKSDFRDFRLSYLLFFTGVYVFYLIIVGGDWMIANRFFVPLIPFLYILSTIGITYAVDKLFKFYKAYDEKTLQRVTRYVNGMVRFLCTALLVATLILLEYRQLIIKDNNANYELQWSMFGKWLKNNVDPNTVIAVGPAGKIPYYSKLYTIDMWGLNNEHIAKTDSKKLQAGHKKFDFDYVLSLNPEFIIGYAGFTDDDIPPKYEKFNAPEDEYKCMDIVFRLKEEYRNKDIRNGNVP